MLQVFFEQAKNLYRHSLSQKHKTKEIIQSKAFEKTSQKEVPQVKKKYRIQHVFQREMHSLYKNGKYIVKNLPHLVCMFITEHTLSQALNQ